MSRIWFLGAVGAALLAAGCVPSSQYLEMRSKYEEEANKNRRLAEENNQLRSQADLANRDTAAAKIEADALRNKLAVWENADIWSGKYGPDIDVIARGRGLRLKAVTFNSGSADLSKRGKRALDQVAADLRSKGNVMVVVDGHTDNDPIRRSPHRSNWELSGKRAAAVVDYLVKARAVAPKYALLRGFGEHKPITPNDTKANKAKNRRVEIFYARVGKGGTPATTGGASLK